MVLVMLKRIKRLVFKVLEYTAFDPLSVNFPKLPNNKYGVYVCEACNKNLANRWSVDSKEKMCDECVIKEMGK
jgi:hypothetical protein